MKMKSIVALCLLAVISASFASPKDTAEHSLVRQRRQLNLDIFRNTRQLIEDLITNLNKAAQQAKDAIAQFNAGLLEQAKQYRDKFLADLQKLRERVTDSINKLQEKFVSSGSAVGECINSHRDEAETIFNDASSQTMACTESRIQEGGELIKGLSTVSENGQELATTAFAEMRNCSEQHSGNILGTGACLGAVAVRTEMKGAAFLMQSGLTIGRINLYMSTLPAALEVCAGSSLVSAGVGTAKILMDIGSCSTNSVLTNFGINTSSSTSISSVAESVSTSASSTISGISSSVPTAISGNSPINFLLNL